MVHHQPHLVDVLVNRGQFTVVPAHEFFDGIPAGQVVLFGRYLVGKLAVEIAPSDLAFEDEVVIAMTLSTFC